MRIDYRPLVFLALICVGGSGFGERQPLPRMKALVTNDFAVADLKPFFKTFEATSTNIVFRFRDDVGPMFYIIDDADMSRSHVISGSSDDKAVVSLGVGQSLGHHRFHHGLIIKGFSDDSSRGFDITSYFNGTAFGRGVEVKYGRLMLPSCGGKINGDDIVIVGAKELKRKALGPSNVSESEISSIKLFLKEFSEAYNAKDLETVKRLSGKSSERWIRWMEGGEELVGIEVFRCLASGGRIIVSAEVALLGSGKDVYPFPVTFEILYSDGGHIIEDMTLSPSDRWNAMFDAAVGASEKLIDAINNRDLTAVEQMLYKNESRDLDAELSKRDLMWIKDAIVQGVRISRPRMTVCCEQGDWMHGYLPVPCSPDGSNIVRTVSFAGAKIRYGITVKAQ